MYLFPTQKLVYGPSQVESRIDQDPTISAELTLWNQQGSSVNRGNMMVIPINQSILYIKPLYLESTTSQIPQLKRVVVAYGSRIEMAKTLDAALKVIFGAGAVAAPSPAAPSAPPPGKPGKAPPTSVKKLIDQAADEFNRAEEAQRKGDWAAYGEQQRSFSKP